MTVLSIPDFCMVKVIFIVIIIIIRERKAIFKHVLRKSGRVKNKSKRILRRHLYETHVGRLLPRRWRRRRGGTTIDDKHLETVFQQTAEAAAAADSVYHVTTTEVYAATGQLLPGIGQ